MSKYSQSNANVQLIQDIDTALESGDSNRLVSLLSNEYNQTQLTQSWEFFSTANQHHKLRQCTITLTKLFGVPEIATQVKTIVTELLTARQRVFYRCLDSHRTNLSVPALQLLRRIVAYRNGALCDLVVSNLDFKSVNSLAQPSKVELADSSYLEKFDSSPRYHFGKLFLDVVRYSHSNLRREFLIQQQSKGVNGWFKYIDTHTSPEMVLETLETYREKILDEHAYKKMVKAKLVPESVVKKLIDCYEVKEVRTEVHSFLLTLSTNKAVGVVYGEPLSASPLVIDSHKYHVNNKHIFTILTDLKPWVDELQNQLVVSILQTMPELIPVYNARMFSVLGPHEPKLTSFWIGYSLLMLKVVGIQQDDVPPFSPEDSLSAPELLIQLVLPSQLSKSAVTKSLQFEYYMVRQIVSNILLAVFNKFEKLTAMFGSSKSDIVLVKDLTDLLLTRLPDVSVIIGALNDQKNNKLLFLSLSQILQRYLQTFPTVTANINYLDDLIANESMSNLDIAILNTHLQIQKLSSSTSGVKWWNKAGSKSSLFTTLCKLPVTLDASLLDKVADVLYGMCRSTTIFTDYKNPGEQVWGNQLYCLCHSLLVFSRTVDAIVMEKIYNLLDETVSRCARAPYKYIDQATQLVNRPGHHLSPFVITLLEQLNFVNDDKVTGWLVLFLRELAVVNEPIEYLETLPVESELLQFSDFEANSKLYVAMVGESADTNWDIILTSPLAKLSYDLPNIITSHVEAVGILFRIKMAMQSSQDVEDLFVRLSNYLSLNLEALPFNEPKYWTPFFLDTNNSPQRVKVAQHTMALLYEVSHSAKVDLSRFASHVMSLIGKLSTEPERQVLASSAWAQSNTSLVELCVSSDPIIAGAILTTMVDRRVSIPFKTFSAISTHTSILAQLVPFLDPAELDNRAGEYIKSHIFKKTAVVLALINAKAELSQFVLELFDAESFDSLFKTTDGVKLLTLVGSSVESASFSEYIHNQSLQRLNEDHLHVLSLLLVPLSDSLTAEEKPVVLEKLLAIPKFSNVAAQVFSPEFLRFLLEIMDTNDSNLASYFKTWCERATLYITKMFAETASTILPVEFQSFINEFHLVSSTYSQLLPSHLLESQMEVILGSAKWVLAEDVMKYCSCVVLNTSRKINASKILQIFLNNEHNVLCGLPSKFNVGARFHSALVIFSLFKSNVSKLSTQDLQLKLVKLYLGTCRSEDLILKQVLTEIESKTSLSWVDQVYSWDYLEDLTTAEIDATGELPRLITEEKKGSSGLIVSINKAFINNAILEMDVLSTSPPFQSKNWQDWVDFNVHSNVVLDLENISEVYRSSKYDSEFLMLLILNNEELVNMDNVESVKFDLKALARSGILQLIVANLGNANANIRQISKRILVGLYATLTEEDEESVDKMDVDEEGEKRPHRKFRRDASLFKVYLGNLLSLYRDSVLDEGKSVPTVVILMLSHFVPILADASHHLFEKVYHFLLAYPKFKPLELPLFKSIALQFSTDDKDSGIRDQEGYYRRLSWLLQTIRGSICSEVDLKVLARDGFMEWLMNLSLSPYISPSLQLQIWGIVAKIQTLPGGSDWLIRGYAGLLTLESKLMEAQAALERAGMGETIGWEVTLLNFEKLIMRTGISVSGNKRVREWTSSDIPNVLKRSHIS